MKDLQEFVRLFTEETIKNIVKIKNCYYMIDQPLLALKAGIKKEPFAAGTFLGETRGSRFRPSTSLISWLAERSDRKLFVNRKAAWLFLCKRDLFGADILRSNADEGLVLVQNETDENLGYGRIIDSLKIKDKPVVENLLDKGDFLRRER